MINQLSIEKNKYIESHSENDFFRILMPYLKKDYSLNLAIGQIKYPGDWEPETDIFQYIDNLDSIRNNPNSFFVFDESKEGFSPFYFFYFDILYNNCKKYNISPKKIIFVSSNLKNQDNHENYCLNHNINEKIYILTYMNFRYVVSGQLFEYLGDNEVNAEKEESFDFFFQETKKNFDGHIGISLSRVNRVPRTLGAYLLSKSNYSEYFHISHDLLTNEYLENFLNTYNFNENLQNFLEWIKNLPLTIDTDDFTFNYAGIMNSGVHYKTIFNIVNETFAAGNSDHRNSMFFSEKTFKPIAHMQPFLIYGQPGCNQFLEKQGFQLYHELFDYSFDNIENDWDRFLEIRKTAENAIETVKNLTREEQIKFRFSFEEKLKHNWNMLVSSKIDSKKFKKLAKYLQNF